MAKPKLLWVNAGIVGPREASAAAFENHFEIEELQPAEMLLAAPGSPWDLICFNFDYPEMTSLKLIPEAKCRWPSAPVLMLTMQNSADLVLWALRSRVFDVLVKPVTAQEIERCLERVHTALQARRSQSQRKSQSVPVPLPAEARYRPQLPGAPRLQAAIAYISKHYTRHICESEVALLCEMSPSWFSREFKAAFGVTFVDYLCSHRLSQAKRLLLNPGMSVADVAAATGFSDPSYFARVFRKQTGIAPSEYRAASLTAALDADDEPPNAASA